MLTTHILILLHFFHPKNFNVIFFHPHNFSDGPRPAFNPSQASASASPPLPRRQNLNVDKSECKSNTIKILEHLKKKDFQKNVKANELEVSDAAGTSATPKTGGIHGNYVDYVVLQFSIRLWGALIWVFCVNFPWKNGARRGRRGRGGSRQRHEPEQQNVGKEDWSLRWNAEVDKCSSINETLVMGGGERAKTR